MRPAATSARMASKRRASVDAYISHRARAPRTQPSSELRSESSARTWAQKASGLTRERPTIHATAFLCRGHGHTLVALRDCCSQLHVFRAGLVRSHTSRLRNTCDRPANKRRKDPGPGKCPSARGIGGCCDGTHRRDLRLPFARTAATSIPPLGSQYRGGGGLRNRIGIPRALIEQAVRVEGGTLGAGE